VQHFEKEPEILDVVRIVVIMDGEPEHGVRSGVTVPNYAAIQSRRNQNGRCKSPSSLGWNEPEVVVPLHVFLLELIKILHTVNSEFLHLFPQVIGGKLGDVTLFHFTVFVGGNEVVGFAENFVEAKGKVRHGAGGLGRWDGGDGSATSARRDGSSANGGSQHGGGQRNIGELFLLYYGT